jgi:hypothetical protein
MEGLFCKQASDGTFNMVSQLIPHMCRFADCDMLMRYHWGLGIGHTYSHTKESTNPTTIEADEDEMAEEADEDEMAGDAGDNNSISGKNGPEEIPHESSRGSDNLDESDSESDSQSSALGDAGRDLADCDEEILLTESYYTHY